VPGDTEEIESGSACAKGIGAGCDSRKDRSTASLNSLPVVRTSRIGGNGKRTYWVAFQPLCRCDRRTEVEEGIHVDLVVEDAHSAAHHEIWTRGWLIGEADARRKVIPVRFKDGVSVLSLDEQPFPRDKICQVFPVAMEWSEIFVAHSQI